ncbi:MAG: hypothetical protein Q7U05_03880 [Polaromonas sp.]|nr:hypothetical protein [Polaromonas sp.]
MSEKPTTETAEYWKAKFKTEQRAKVDGQIDNLFAVWDKSDADHRRNTADRPGAVNQLAVAIKAAMAPSKKEGLDFKTFMRDWEQEEQQELTLTQLEDNRYTVTDESHGEGNLGALVYKLEGLRSLYTYCLKPRKIR